MTRHQPRLLLVAVVALLVAACFAWSWRAYGATPRHGVGYNPCRRGFTRTLRIPCYKPGPNGTTLECAVASAPLNCAIGPVGFGGPGYAERFQGRYGFPISELKHWLGPSDERSTQWYEPMEWVCREHPDWFGIQPGEYDCLLGMSPGSAPDSDLTVQEVVDAQAVDDRGLITAWIAWMQSQAPPVATPTPAPQPTPCQCHDALGFCVPCVQPTPRPSATPAVTPSPCPPVRQCAPGKRLTAPAGCVQVINALAGKHWPLLSWGEQRRTNIASCLAFLQEAAQAWVVASGSSGSTCLEVTP